jgi:hypothetical protein
MCVSAAVNFAGSAVLATVGVVTLTRVKHRRELLFAISSNTVCDSPVY